MQCKVAIFDYDGTLMDTLDAYYALGQQFQHKEKITLFRTKIEFRDILDGGFGKFFKANKFVFIKSPFLLSHIKREAKTVGCDLIRPYDGIISMLDTIRIPKYVVTSNFSDAVQRHLQHFGLSKHFKAVMGVDFHPSKVHKINAVCALENCTPQDIIFVSDTSSDIRQANKAGAFSVAVRYGYGNNQRLEKAMPNRFANSPHEVQQIIQEMIVPSMSKHV